MKNFIQEGTNLQATLSEAVKGGDLIVFPNMVGIAVTDGGEGDTITVNTVGVYEISKGGASVEYKQGQKVFIKADKALAVTASGNTLVGYAWEPSTATETTVIVKLNG